MLSYKSKIIKMIFILTFISNVFSQDVILNLDDGSLNYTSSVEIAGFQFDHNGCVENASGGDAASNGFTVSASSSTVLAFSFSGAVIPSGEGTLIELVGTITDTCLSNFVFSGSGGTSLIVEFGNNTPPPCDDIDSDDICDDIDDCVGNYDECGICNGDGIAEAECDCDGNVVDICGECGGDGSSCIVELNFGDFGDGSMDIIMSSSVDVAGFQFDISGVNLIGSSGGSANANGFTVSSSSSTVLGFSFSSSTIPAGDGVLITLNYEATSLNACFDNIVISGLGGVSLETSAGDCITVGEPSTVSVLYDSIEDIAGFQFGVEEGVTLLGVSGGDAAANGFTVTASASTVLGFSFSGSVIPSGSGVLVDLLVDDPSALCLTNLVISGEGGASLEAFVDGCNTIVYSGCTDEDSDSICDSEDECIGEYDECGVCNGDGIADGSCDCNDNIEDCSGVCGGDAVEDECGVCNGDGPDEYYDCDGNCLNDEDGDLVCDELDDCIGEYDECEICNGNGSSCADPDVTLSLDGGNLNYVSSVDIAGFQFNHNGCVVSATGGDAIANGFTVSASGSTVLGFSFSGSVIPSGEGTLIELSGDIVDDCLSSFVFSGTSGTSLIVEFIIGIDSYYNVDLVETGNYQLVIFQSSISLFDLGDEIGVFDANGILESCDPSSGCIEPSYGEILVGSGIWVGSQMEISAIMSEDFSDFGGSILNGAIDGNPLLIKVWKVAEQTEYIAIATWSAGGGDFGDLILAVSELELVGGSVLGCTDPNACNYNPDATEDDGSCLEEDCLGQCGGDAVVDECGVCDGDGIADGACDCDGNIEDCAGECGGDAVIDDCGECGGDGSSCSGPDVYLTLDGGDLNYTSSVDIAGFQFSHNGCVESAGGGDAASNEFTVSSGGSTILAFSFSGNVIPAGEGTLIELGGVITDDCLFEFIFSGEGGITLDVEFYSPPCDDIDSDEICDDVDDCVGDYDECGVCNGNGTSCPDTPQNLVATGDLNQIILNWSPAQASLNQTNNIDRDTCDPITGWCYTLSIENSYYMFENIYINNQLIHEGSVTAPTSCPNLDCDVIGAICNDNLVSWTYPFFNSVFTIPVMGQSGVTPNTEEYCGNGQVPSFVVFDISSGQVINLEYIGNDSIPGFTSLQTYMFGEDFDYDGFLNASIEISYNVYRDGLLYAEGIQETTFIDQNLEDNEYHCYQVTQFVGDQESGFSNQSCATTDMPGCTNIEACNYNPEATIDDGSCLEEDCLGECGGDAVIDDCGVCDGNNDDQDCFGECGGDAELDDCGVCDGDGLTCYAKIIVDSPLTGYISYNGKVTIVINDEQSEINLDDSVEVFIDNFSVKKILYQDISDDNSFEVNIKYLWDHFISLESVNLKLVVLDPTGEPYTNNDATLEINNIQVSPPSNFVINGVQDTLSVFTYYINNAIYESYSLTEDDWIGFFCNNEENGLNIIGTQKWGYINPEEYLEILEIEIDENWCQSEDGLCTWSRLRLYQDIVDNGSCDIGDTLSIQMYIAENDSIFPAITQNEYLLGENNIYIDDIWANVEDCNGVAGGTAFYDECDICSGGDTGIIPNDTLDCNGDCDGLALIDDCGICCDGNTSIECSTYNNDGDIPVVTGVMDCNNHCPGDSDYGIEFPDCQGDCFGDAYLDECEICDYDSNNNNETCSGCIDPLANNTDEDATLDDGSCTYDVQVAINEFFYRATINVDIPDYVEIINVTQETKDLNNWTIETSSGDHNLSQYNIEFLPQSLILITGSGNFYDSLGNIVNLNNRYVIPGFSLSSYDDYIILRDSENDIVDEVIYSDDDVWPVGNSNRGHALELNNFYYDNNDVEYWFSADESVMSPYMYNSDGELENYGTPLENNSNYIGNEIGCDGVLFSDATLDDCDVCDGNNLYNIIGNSSSGWNCGENYENCDEVDCEGDCIEGTPNWDLGEDILPDCNGICFGDAEFDDCGLCGGDNSTCSDCAGIPNGDTVVDECGLCDGDNYNCEDPDSSCLCAGCMDNTPGLAPDIYGCCADQVWNPNESICQDGTSVNEEGYCLENNGYYFTNYDPLILIDNGSCSTWNPEIISIIDIPEDQGYHVYLTFSKAHFDDESLPRETAGYSIERLDNIEGIQTWVNVASGFAYGQLEYTYEVETLINYIDSLSNGNTTFRVIASMDEGLYLSDEFSGFSIDNIIPSSPTGINILIIDNNINLNWNQNQDIDLDYYNIYYKYVDEEEWNYDGSTNQTNYNLDYDSDLVTEIFITAVDINDNESESSQIVSTLGLAANINLPKSFEIFGSYPNPFNPITNISYSIPSSDLVQVSVYNINGILVKIIYDGIQQSGLHNIKWDANLYASGIYFIKIHYKNKVEIQKVLLLK